jgi:hypothetical protein
MHKDEKEMMQKLHQSGNRQDVPGHMHIHEILTDSISIIYGWLSWRLLLMITLMEILEGTAIFAWNLMAN